MELGADDIGIGMVEVAEDGQGLLPGVARGGEVAGFVMGVAEVGEHVGLEVAVAEVPDQGEGPVVAGNGLRVVAEVMVGVAEAVPGGGLPVAVVEVLVQGEDLLACGEGPPVVAEVPTRPGRPSTGLEFGRYHAVLIGNEDYRNLKKLKTPDPARVKLQTAYQYKVDDKGQYQDGNTVPINPFKVPVYIHARSGVLLSGSVPVPVKLTLCPAVIVVFADGVSIVPFGA